MLDTLPTGNDLWSIGRIVPSVLLQAYDVGGHNSFRNQTLRAHGSGNDEAKYQIDGMDVSHGSGSGSGSTLYFDTFMFAEVNYTSGNNPAEIAQGGVVYSLITKTGTNRFRADFPRHRHPSPVCRPITSARRSRPDCSRVFQPGCSRSVRIPETASCRSWIPVSASRGQS